MGIVYGVRTGSITKPGDVLAVNAAMLILVNIMVARGSAMWSLAAPVLVPMLMLVDVAPETTQALWWGLGIPWGPGAPSR